MNVSKHAEELSFWAVLVIRAWCLTYFT